MHHILRGALRLHLRGGRSGGGRRPFLRCIDALLEFGLEEARVGQEVALLSEEALPVGGADGHRLRAAASASALHAVVVAVRYVVVVAATAVRRLVPRRLPALLLQAARRLEALAVQRGVRHQPTGGRAKVIEGDEGVRQVVAEGALVLDGEGGRGRQERAQHGVGGRVLVHGEGGEGVGRGQVGGGGRLAQGGSVCEEGVTRRRQFARVLDGGLERLVAGRDVHVRLLLHHVEAHVRRRMRL